jgi:serine/threonine protein kinase
MNDNPHPNLAAVRAIVDQIAKGLRAFQRKEMLHQDIRPENIMIDTTGTAKIIDLGSVRVAGVSEALPAIDTAEVLGTFQYAAPEYFLGKQGTHKSDLYSLGVVAYEMVAGWLPYGDGVARAKTPKAQAALVYTSARENAPNVPEWMDAALRKAVSIDPANRHEALSEFVTDLNQPSATYKRAAFRPLSERNPLLFWKSMCLVLVLTIIALLATR